MISWSNAKSISPIFSPLVFVNVHPSSSLFKESWYKRVDSATRSTPLAYVENLMNPPSLSLSRDKRRIVVVDPEKLRVARRIAHTPALARQSLISFSWKRKHPPPPSRTLYSVHILKHDRLLRAAIMYYAFAIVKRVRAPLRALRAPRLSEPAWRSRACSYWCSTTRACVLYVCIHFLQGEKKERERERGSKRSEEGLLGRCSRRRISQTPFSQLFSLVSSLFPSLTQWSWSNSKKQGDVLREGMGYRKFRGDRICGLKPPYPRRNTETSGIVEIFGW